MKNLIVGDKIAKPVNVFNFRLTFDSNDTDTELHFHVEGHMNAVEFAKVLMEAETWCIERNMPEEIEEKVQAIGEALWDDWPRDYDGGWELSSWNVTYFNENGDEFHVEIER